MKTVLLVYTNEKLTVNQINNSSLKKLLQTESDVKEGICSDHLLFSHE